MTSLTIEPLGLSVSARDARTLDSVRRRAAAELAGRRVWCVSALPDGRSSARTLRERLDGGGVHADPLEVTPPEDLDRLARGIEAMLRGAAAAASLGPAERELYADGVRDGDALIGPDVAAEDVVVLHDALAAALAQAARERGAHVVWRVDVRTAPQEATVTAAWTFLRPFTSAVDAYVTTWLQPLSRLRRVERVAAVMPCAGVVSAKDVGSGSEDLGWSSALADVAHARHQESVGGTLHARPAVAAR
jgi:hypothetical protein